MKSNITFIVAFYCFSLMNNVHSSCTETRTYDHVAMQEKDHGRPLDDIDSLDNIEPLPLTPQQQPYWFTPIIHDLFIRIFLTVKNSWNYLMACYAACPALFRR